jgi:hypothetical protein
VGAGVKQVEQFRWYMPNPNPRGKPYLTRHSMTRDEATKAGALHPEPTSRRVIDVAETPEEELQVRMRSDTSKLGGR